MRTDRRPLAMVMAAREPFAGVGVGLSRWGRFRMGFGGAAVVGWQDGQAASRAELWAGYHLNPVRSRGWAPYAGAGGALAVGPGDPVGYLTVFVGAEWRPGASRGWFAEVGVGGGPRVVVGYRVSRRRPA